MAQRPVRRKPNRKATVNTTGAQLLSSIVRNIQLRAFRDIDPELHLDQAANNPELTVFNFIRRHHDRYQVIPTAAVIAENTGVVLPTTDQPCDYYMTRVKERAMFNNISAPYNQLQEALANPRKRMEEMKDAIDKLWNVKSRFIDAGTGIETSEYLLAEVQRLQIERRMSGGTIQGITTGYGEVDREMDGYNRGDLVAWVGRPGRSKSWKLLKQCHAAWVAGYKPLYVSMEMGGIQNMRRILGIHSGINPTHIKRGTIQTLAQPFLDRAYHELLEQRPLHMVTANFSRTVDQIATFVTEYTPDIVYIDAGYLLSPRKKRFGSSGRRETISDVIEELKELAGNSGIPIVITVQFNRQAEHRRRSGGESYSPIAHLSLAEIGETDVIGQACTHVFGIEYPPAPLGRDDYRCFGFLKGREGESGWWLTKFMPTQTSIVDLAEIPRHDPIYEIVRAHAARASQQRDGSAVDPSRRTQLMRLNNG